MEDIVAPIIRPEPFICPMEVSDAIASFERLIDFNVR
jgi:hypothetical protein